MAKLAVLLLISLLYSVTNSKAPSNRNICPSTFFRIAGKCFSFKQQKMKWSPAKSACKKAGGDLAIIKTKEQYKKLIKHMNKKYPPGKYWVSGRLSKGKWVWTNGNLMNMKAFGKNPPKKSGYFCASTSSNTNKYWSAPCHEKKRFICEMKFKKSVNLKVPKPNRNPSQTKPQSVNPEVPKSYRNPSQIEPQSVYPEVPKSYRNPSWIKPQSIYPEVPKSYRNPSPIEPQSVDPEVPTSYRDQSLIEPQSVDHEVPKTYRNPSLIEPQSVDPEVAKSYIDQGLIEPQSIDPPEVATSYRDPPQLKPERYVGHKYK